LVPKCTVDSDMHISSSIKLPYPNTDAEAVIGWPVFDGVLV